MRLFLLDRRREFEFACILCNRIWSIFNSTFDGRQLIIIIIVKVFAELFYSSHTQLYGTYYAAPFLSIYFIQIHIIYHDSTYILYVIQYYFYAQEPNDGCWSDQTQVVEDSRTTESVEQDQIETIRNKKTVDSGNQHNFSVKSHGR